MINLCPGDTPVAYFHGLKCCGESNDTTNFNYPERKDTICLGKSVPCPKEGTCEDGKFHLQTTQYY